MKVLVITQYFWPENFKINDVCMGLQERGYEVTVLTGKPNYPTGIFFKGYGFFRKQKEQWNGILVYRCPLFTRGKGGGIRLLVNYFSFAFFATLRLIFMGGKFDRIFVYEPSPVTVGIPMIYARWKYKAPSYFWVNDLWPESLTAAGGVTNRYMLRCVDKLTRYIYRHSTFVLAQSPAFIPYLLKQGVPENKIVYYPQLTESFYRVIPKSEKFANFFPNGFNIVFAGNIGAAQGFDTLLAAAIQCREKCPQVNWVIIGDGRMKEEVKQRVTELGIQDCFHIIGSYPPRDMPFFFSHADALFIALKKSEIFALTIPTKLQTYMASGKPIIGSIDGIGASLIMESGSGIAVPAEDVDGLTKAVQVLAAYDKQALADMGKNARACFESQFERELLLDKLENVLAQSSSGV